MRAGRHLPCHQPGAYPHPLQSLWGQVISTAAQILKQAAKGRAGSISAGASSAISKEQTWQCAQAEISWLEKVRMPHHQATSWREGDPAGSPLGAEGWHGAKHLPPATCRRDAVLELGLAAAAAQLVTTVPATALG